jgi:RecA-family ATPase
VPLKGEDWNDAHRAGVSAREEADKAWAAKSNGNDNSHLPTDWRSHTVSAADLRTMAFPPVSYVVPGFIPEGISLLAGRPKIGKSWLALDIALGIAGEREVLGGSKPKSGDVLYCALEDTNSRLQRRITKLMSPLGIWPEKLKLATQWRRLDDGGAEDIIDWHSSVPEPRLVILDTLVGVRPERQSRDTTYEGDYRALINVHKIANEKGFAVLALTHTRKMEAEDPLDTISGTLGLVGCADTGLVLARTPQGTTLYVRGRDVEEHEHAVTFNSETCRWAVLGEASEVRRSETRRTIIEVLADATEALSPEQIAVATDIKRNAVDQRLYRMVKDGEAVKVGSGRYVHPNKAVEFAARKAKA